MSEEWDHAKLVMWFKTISPSEWYELSKLAKEKNLLTSKDRSFLYSMGSVAYRPDSVTFKQAAYAKKLHDQMESFEEEERPSFKVNKKGISVTSQFNTIKHLTARMAWHDKKWDGKICADPESNEYCVGEYSLLSRRIRHDRNLDFEKSIAVHRDMPDLFPTMASLKYQPPCYWSINANGKEHINIEHTNPAVHPHKVDTIKEELPPYSIFSWPFKLSFVKNENQSKHYGKYFPEPMLDSRIDHFQSKFKENESIVFLYANFDNPVSGEDSNYLVLGCAFLKGRGEKTHFQIPEKILSDIRERKGANNFSSLNWALRYTLDFPKNGIMLPYHEYLEYDKQCGDPDNTFTNQMRVIIEEPELMAGFKFVAMDIDSDHAIHLLFKIRKSILIIQEHNIVHEFDSSEALEVVERMIDITWKKRGYFPSFSILSRALLGFKNNEEKLLDELIPLCKEKDPDNYPDTILRLLEKPLMIGLDFHKFEYLLLDLVEAIKDNGLSVKQYLTLCMISLTRRQFDRLIDRKEQTPKLLSIADNPYLLFEEYTPTKEDEDLLNGDKIDGYIDFHKIDIALFPHRKYLKPINWLHSNFEISDPRRVRAFVLYELNRTSTVVGYFLPDQAG